jgi:hypothetical protein
MGRGDIVKSIRTDYSLQRRYGRIHDCGKRRVSRFEVHVRAPAANQQISHRITRRNTLQLRSRWVWRIFFSTPSSSLRHEDWPLHWGRPEKNSKSICDGTMNAKFLILGRHVLPCVLYRLTSRSRAYLAPFPSYWGSKQNFSIRFSQQPRSAYGRFDTHSRDSTSATYHPCLPVLRRTVRLGGGIKWLLNLWAETNLRAIHTLQSRWELQAGSTEQKKTGSGDSFSTNYFFKFRHFRFSPSARCTIFSPSAGLWRQNLSILKKVSSALRVIVCEI